MVKEARNVIVGVITWLPSFHLEVKETTNGLLVNGIGMTRISITKFIAHLPLTFHRGQPKSILVICFRMGDDLSLGIFKLGH